MSNENLTGYPSIDKPWMKYYSEEAINTPLPECTMYEYIYGLNQDNLDRIAINYYGTNITYGEMFNNISDVASALKAIGVKQNDIVTVCMINSPETINLIFALNKIGATANMIYGVSTVDEIKKYLIDTHTKIVFTLDMFQEKFVDIVNELPIQKVIVSNVAQSMAEEETAAFNAPVIPIPNDSKFISWETFMSHKKDSTDVCHNPDGIAVINYTGGTTGGSKGVMLSNKAVVSVSWQYLHRNAPMSRENTWALILPLFIAYGVACSLMFPLAIGMKLIVRMPMAESVSALCQKFKPNFVMYGPAFWEAFADENLDLDLSYLIDPVSGGDMLHPNVEEKINSYLETHGSQYKIMNGYGMTETAAAVCINYKNAYEAGSVGIPYVKNIISAFNTETGEECKFGQVGEICIHTPSMMSGYINNEEETAKIMKLHNDGKLWIHTGDLGFISENGFVHISGRLKRFISFVKDGIFKKVFSLDVEKELMRFYKIEKCAVVPMPDAMFNEVPVAYVILKPEYRNDKFIEDELKTHCEKNLQDAYRPRRYEFIEKFPLTKVGKVDYITLEKRIKDKNSIK